MRIILHSDLYHHTFESLLLISTPEIIQRCLESLVDSFSLLGYNSALLRMLLILTRFVGTSPVMKTAIVSCTTTLQRAMDRTWSVLNTQ